MSVFQKYKNGNWYVEFWYQEAVTKKRKRFRHSTGAGITKKQAEKLERQWKENLEKFGSMEPPAQKTTESRKQGVPFSGFAKKFIEDYAKVRNKPSEVKSKLSIIRNHLYPFFGDTSITQIDRKQIDMFIAAKKRAGASPKTINNLLGTLSRMFNLAIEWGYLDRSPMIGVKKLKEAEPGFDFYTAEETLKFLAECRRSEPYWYPYFVAAFNTGMRLGELSGLKRCDVDFDQNVIHVRRNLWHGQEGTPKGGKNRQIPMNTQLRDTLEAHCEGLKPDDRVFEAKRGTELTRNSQRNPFFRIIEKANLKRIRFHDIRHTFASQLVINKVPLRAVQQLLGHADIRMTERYSHLTHEATQEAVDTLTGGLVNEGETNPAPHLPPIVNLAEYRETQKQEKARNYN